MTSFAIILKRALKRLPFAQSMKWRLSQLVAQVRFRQEFMTFKNLSSQGSASQRFAIRWQDRYPCLNDRTATTSFDWHYLYHTAWAARIVAQTCPAYHVDIASDLYFCALVSAFVPVRFYDYRPADLRLSNLSYERADLLARPFPDASIHSLSCMHVIEHIGLGRYGDPLDPNGDLKAMSELKRVLGPGGSLLFVVPVGEPKVVFNAHRVYAYAQIVGVFADLQLKQFALITENLQDGLIENATVEMADAQTYGCG